MKRQRHKEEIRFVPPPPPLFFLSLPVSVWSECILDKRNFPDYKPLLLTATVSYAWQWLVYGQVDEVDLSVSGHECFPSESTYHARLRNVVRLSRSRGWSLIGDLLTCRLMFAWPSQLKHLAVTDLRCRDFHTALRQMTRLETLWLRYSHNLSFDNLTDLTNLRESSR